MPLILAPAVGMETFRPLGPQQVQVHVSVTCEGALNSEYIFLIVITLITLWTTATAAIRDCFRVTNAPKMWS